MGEGKKPELSIEQQIAKLATELADAKRQIQRMQTLGGFTDAKSHSIRATRIEERLERVEMKVDALLDVAAFNSTMMEDHLGDRHGIDVNRDDAIDAISWRKIRRRLREMADKLGLTNKRNDLTTSRQDENRLRPQRQSASV
jgi:predicted membrane chloride channel (bestrophin family)